MTSEVNDDDLFNAEPILLVLDAETRLSFSVKTSLSPAETLLALKL